MCLPGQPENKAVLQQGSLPQNAIATGYWGGKHFREETLPLCCFPKTTLKKTTQQRNLFVVLQYKLHAAKRDLK